MWFSLINAKYPKVKSRSYCSMCPIVATVALGVGLIHGIGVKYAGAQPPFVEKIDIQAIDPVHALDSPPVVRAISCIISVGSSAVIGLETVQGLAVALLDEDLTLKHYEVLGIEIGKWRWSGGCVAGDEVYLLANPCTSDQSGNSSKIFRYVPIENKLTTLAMPKHNVMLHAIASLNSKELVAVDSRNAFICWSVRDPDSLSVHRNIFDFVPHQYPAGMCLFPAASDQVFGSYKGRLFRYHRKDDFFEYLGMLPGEFGHLSQQRLSAMAKGPGGCLIGGTNADGYLFSLDIQSRKLEPRGKPTDGTSITHLVAAHDQTIWGIADAPAGISRLFHFDVKAGTLRDLGVPGGRFQSPGRSWFWRSFVIRSMTVLSDGRILMGEEGIQSKLLVFDPAKIKK